MNIDIQNTNLLDHPAIKAWSKIGPELVEPVSIEILKWNYDGRMVFLLEGAGRGLGAVIAKRCWSATGLIERTIYEQILPQLQVTFPRYYGFVEEDAQFCWLFLEDLGRRRFSPINEEHRSLAAHWLGLMHTTAHRLATTACLPERGTDYYLELLRTARCLILQSMSNPALPLGGVEIMQLVVSQCNFLEYHWDRVEDFCKDLPLTLVHGDFRPKNVYVRTDQTGTHLFPIDWELAGRGIPAADLAPAHHLTSHYQVDLDKYWSIVREFWPTMSLSTIVRLAGLGCIFRRLAAIYWASLEVGFAWPEKAVENLRIYQAELHEVIQTAPWAI